MSNIVKLKINGKEITAEKGTTILRAALDNGIYIPHFCYHPALSMSGNCRMCIVKASNSPKLAASCATSVADGIEVDTNAPDVVETRKAVMEFYLIHHPIDCPVCDQAGECTLQDYSFDYGSSHSRFVEKKNIYHTKTLGPVIKLWGNRCIVCARCVRFCDEITATGELTIVERGDKNVIDTFPGIELNNPLSLCTVDVCPVGALISLDFLYKARVWFLKHYNSVCNMCATGCNIRIDTYEEKIKRYKPRLNKEVNNFWLCDHGRLSYKLVHSDNRLNDFTINSSAVSSSEAISFVRKHIEKFSGKWAGLISAHATNEEAYLFKQVMQAVFHTDKIFTCASSNGVEWTAKDGFHIDKDKNPNRKGLALIYGNVNAEASVRQCIEKITSGEIEALFFFDPSPNLGPNAELLSALDKLQFFAYQGMMNNELASRANLVLAGSSFAEKYGTYINGKNRIQKITKAVEAPCNALDDILILQKLTESQDIRTASLIYRKLAVEKSFLPDSHSDINELGNSLEIG